MKLKCIGLAFILCLQTVVASAASLSLGGGEAAIIQANVSTQVSCSGPSGLVPGPSQGSDGGFNNVQCAQENANLRVQNAQLQSELYQCRTISQKPKVWNCTYVCGGNNGMGSSEDKSVACKAAKQDSGVQCASQCSCTLE